MGGLQVWKAGGLEGGRLEGWKEGRAGGLEGWKAGGLEGWKAGGLEGCKAGGLEGWKAGWKLGWKVGGLEGKRGTERKLPDVLKLGGPMPLLLDLVQMTCLSCLNVRVFENRRRNLSNTCESCSPEQTMCSLGFGHAAAVLH